MYSWVGLPSRPWLPPSASSPPEHRHTTQGCPVDPSPWAPSGWCVGSRGFMPGPQHLPPAATEEGSAGEGGHRVTLGVYGLELVLPQDASQKCSQNIRGTCEVQCEPDQGQPRAGRLQGTRQRLPQPRVDKDSQVVSGPNWRKVREGQLLSKEHACIRHANLRTQLLCVQGRGGRRRQEAWTRAFKRLEPTPVSPSHRGAGGGQIPVL